MNFLYSTQVNRSITSIHYIHYNFLKLIYLNLTTDLFCKDFSSLIRTKLHLNTGLWVLAFGDICALKTESCLHKPILIITSGTPNSIDLSKCQCPLLYCWWNMATFWAQAALSYLHKYTSAIHCYRVPFFLTEFIPLLQSAVWSYRYA